MNKTQSGGRNYTCWKVFTRIVHRNVTQSDESEALHRGFFKAFTFTVMQKKPLPPTMLRRRMSIAGKEEMKTSQVAFVFLLLCKHMMDILIHPWVQPAKLVWEKQDTQTLSRFQFHTLI